MWVRWREFAQEFSQLSCPAQTRARVVLGLTGCVFGQGTKNDINKQKACVLQNILPVKAKDFFASRIV